MQQNWDTSSTEWPSSLPSAMNPPPSPLRCYLLKEMGRSFSIRPATRAFIEKYQGNIYSLFDREGGDRWDSNSGVFSAWGSWAEAHSQARAQCISVCVTETAPHWNKYIRDEYSGTKNRFCIACKAALGAGGRDFENCSVCAELYLDAHKRRGKKRDGRPSAHLRYPSLHRQL